jgi:hypothetical protein
MPNIATDIRNISKVRASAPENVCRNLGTTTKIPIRNNGEKKIDALNGISSMSLTILSNRQMHRLLTFYFALNFDQRRSRFGAAMSDGAILKRLRFVDWERAVVVVCALGNRIVAVAEMHFMSSKPCADLAVFGLESPFRSDIWCHLVQVCAFAAGHRQCPSIHVQFNPDFPQSVFLLQSIGEVEFDGETAVCSVEGYCPE